MAHRSDPRFHILHAVRVKGFAKPEVVAEITGLEHGEVEGHLRAFGETGHAQFREGRLAAWMLTPAGKEHHLELLAAELAAAAYRDALHGPYPTFLGLNDEFKQICTDWQLRGGAQGVPNDHSDHAYDRVVIDRLLDLDDRAQPVVSDFADVLHRYLPYSPRLSKTARRVDSGEHHLFTGVMVGSYHDVWMELHEDLIVSLGIDRQKEGSF